MAIVQIVFGLAALIVVSVYFPAINIDHLILSILILSWERLVKSLTTISI